jgi:hypothetical protein
LPVSSKESERFRSPQAALLAVTVIAAIIGVLSMRIGWNPFTPAALIQWAGLSIITLHLSYVIPIGSKLAAASSGRKPVPLGPWHLGRTGWIIDAVSVIWLLVSTACVIYHMEPWVITGVSVFVVLLMLCAAFKHCRLRKRGPASKAITTRQNRIRLEELIRIERKFPQL